MSTLARTPTGDIAIPLRRETDPATLAARSVQDGLGLWQGEWFLNQLEGFPWVQRIFALPRPTMTQIRALLRQAILERPLVASVHDLALTFDRATMALQYTFSATLVTGEIVQGGSGQPFIVTGSPSAAGAAS